MIYDYIPSFFFVAVLSVLSLAAWGGYRLGRRAHGIVPDTSPRYLADSVPAAIHTTLALILGFTFSMAIARFETRRQLVIDEANQINSTFQHSQALRHGRSEIASLLKRYIDARIDYYDQPFGSQQAREVDRRTDEIEKQVFEAAYRVARSDRGAIENWLLVMLNQLSDLRNARNFALVKTLPREIYWVLLIVAASGAWTAGYVRGHKGERGGWQPAILITLISLLFFMILDIDQPRMGGIQISQDAMIAVREQMLATSSPPLSRGEAAGKASSRR